MEFGYRLRELRKAKGLGLREFARLLDKSPSYLSNIERGAVPPPSAEIVLEMADALAADRDELLAMAKRFDTEAFEEIRKNAVRLENAEKTIKFLSSAMNLDETDNLGGMEGILEIVIGERILNPSASGIMDSARILKFILGIAASPEEELAKGIELRREVAMTVWGMMMSSLHPYGQYPVREDDRNLIDSIVQVLLRYPKELVDEIVKREDLLAFYHESLRDKQVEQ